MIKEDPFINVMVEQTGAHLVVHQSHYDKYPQMFRHLGAYKEGEQEQKEEPNKPKESTRQEMMDELSVKGITFSANANKAELKALLEGE